MAGSDKVKRLTLEDISLETQVYGGRVRLILSGWRKRRDGSDELVEVTVENQTPYVLGQLGREMLRALSAMEETLTHMRAIFRGEL